MKVLFITSSVDKLSGWGRLSHELAHSAQRLGLIPLVMAEQGGDSAFSIKKASSSFAVLVNMWKARLASRNAEVVHAFDVWPYAIYAFAAVLFTDKKLFVNAVGTYSIAPLKSFWKRQIIRLVLHRADKVFSISRFVQDEMSKSVDMSNSIVVHLGFSPLPPVNEEESERYALEFDVDLSRHPIILTVGAIKHRKGQLDTTRAVAMLVKQYPDILYLIVGREESKEYSQKIRDFARENGIERNILMLHNVKDDKALSFFYRSCDLFVMNSNNRAGHVEGFGMVFVEAASVGKPVVGSSGCGIEDAMKDGSNGYLTRQGDSNDIARGIAKALGEKSSLGKNSIEFAKSFSWDKTMSTYVKFYNA